MSVYVGGDLYGRAREALGDEFNWSAGFREYLEAAIAEKARSSCAHDVLMCRECREPVDVPETGTHT